MVAAHVQNVAKSSITTTHSLRKLRSSCNCTVQTFHVGQFLVDALVRFIQRTFFQAVNLQKM